MWALATEGEHAGSHPRHQHLPHRVIMLCGIPSSGTQHRAGCESVAHLAVCFGHRALIRFRLYRKRRPALATHCLRSR